MIPIYAMFFIILPKDSFQSSIKKAPINENCQAYEVITTEGHCKDASKKLGLTYHSKITRDYESHPLGCHYSYFSDRTWFNRIVNGPTYPGKYGDFSGVCDSLEYFYNEYSFHEEKYCYGPSYRRTFTTLDQAKAECNEHEGCGSITDTDCAHDHFSCCLSKDAYGSWFWTNKRVDPDSSSTCRTVAGNIIGRKCKFPFIYNKWNDYPYVPASFLRWFPNEIEFESCTAFRNSGRLWCATKVTSNDRYIPGQWGECPDTPICRTGGVFEKYPIGRNCPVGRMVVTAEKCKAASAVLGLNYKGLIMGLNIRGHTKHLSRPAGCYFWGENSGFNDVVDPSQINPMIVDVRGAVCVKE